MSEEIVGYLVDGDDGSVNPDFNDCVRLGLSDLYSMDEKYPETIDIVSYVKMNVSVLDEVSLLDEDFIIDMIEEGVSEDYSPLEYTLDVLHDFCGDPDGLYPEVSTQGMIDAEDNFLRGLRLEIAKLLVENSKLEGILELNYVPEVFKQLEEDFLLAIEAEYVPWACEAYDTVTVDVAKWLEDENG